MADSAPRSAAQNSANSRETAPLNYKRDFLASVVVFLVALPLCMGIAIASGVPVAAGLITGIVGGLVVGLLGGAPLQVSGPAAGLTVIVLVFVQQYGLPLMGTVVVIAGLIQLVAGFCKMGQWFRAVSPAVIKGMLAGIGVLIFSSQFHVMVDEKPPGGGLANLMAIPEAVAKGLPLPEWTSESDRQFRTELLKEFGHLHEKQEEIHELVAERVSPLATKAEQQLEAGSLQPLMEQQAEVAAELAEMVERLREFDKFDGKKKEQKDLIAAGEVALASSREALHSLEEGPPLAALRGQITASKDIERLLPHLKSHAWAAKVGLLALAVIILWQFLPSKIRMIPGPLVSVVIATAACAFFYLPVLYVEVPDRLLDSVHSPSWHILRDADWTVLLQTALVIAIVASAETLLCATAVDQMHTGPRANYDRELWAQGAGNMVAGMLGGLPMTGVIVRSAANVQAGGTTRWSAFLHGIWLLIFVAGLGFVLNMIPTAALAAILVYTGYKLVNVKAMKELYHYGKSELAIYLVTLTVIVVKDLLSGVLVGIGLSAAKLLYAFTHLKASVETSENNEKALLRLEGAATFIRLPMLAKALDEVPNGAELHVDFQRLTTIDHACLDLLMNWGKQHSTTGGKLVIDWDSLRAQFNRVRTSEQGANNNGAPQPDAEQPDSEEFSASSRS